MADYTVFDAFSDGVQVIGHDWRYRYLNDPVVRQSGSTREALLGRTMMECYPGIDQTKMFGELRRCMLERVEGRTTNDFTFPDGHKQYFELRLIPVEEGLLVLSVDVTAEHARRVLMEDIGAELEALINHRTAELQSRNRELERMAAIMGHDLRAPLRTMRSFLQLLAHEHGAGLDGNGRRYLDFALEGAERMGALLEALLAHALIGRDRIIEKVDLNRTVAAVRQDLAEQIETANAELVVPEPLPVVEGFAAELQLLLQNLIANALLYSRPDVPPRIEVTAKPDGEGHRVSVRDNGRGIPENRYERIFQFFERLQGDDKPGSGIGLAHCDKIAGLHGGRIWVESEVGVGSTFHFTLQPPPKREHPTEAAQVNA